MHSQKVSNTIYVHRVGGWSEAELNTLTDLVDDWWQTEGRGNISNQYSLVTVMARDMSTEESMGVERTVTPLSNGELLVQAAPGNVALTLKLITGLTGKHRRGRIYIAGITEDDTEGNEIDPVRLTALLASYSVLRDNLIAQNYTWVVASLYDGFDLAEKPDGTIKKVPKPRVTGIITPVTHITADRFFDSQRRRLTGRGL